MLERYEQVPIPINWKIQSSGSLYAAESLGRGTYLFGGSSWQRRQERYSAEIARHALGQLHVARRSEHGYEMQIERILAFPSMVNVIVDLGQTILVCCKYGEQAYTLLDKQSLQPIAFANDEAGNGVYTAIQHPVTNQIVATTRNGILEFLDAQTLQINSTLRLTDGNTRLWSVAASNTTNNILAGDYDGILYVINEGNIVRKIDLSEFKEGISKEAQKYKNAVFGISMTDYEEYIVGTRWGQILWFNFTDSNPKRMFHINHEISYIAQVPNVNSFLIGTREGRLFRSSLEDGNLVLEELLHIAPALQHDNAVWSISFRDNECLITFADGEVVNINIQIIQQMKGGQNQRG